MTMHCAECGLEIRNGELCNTIVEEEHGSLVQHPAHLDCRLALAREWAGAVRLLMVLLMQRQAEKGRVAA